MQKIITKNHGTIEFIKTWVDGNIHIGRCPDGSYRHIGGPVVMNREDLSAIPYGAERDAADEWFEATYVRKPAKVQEAAEVPTVTEEAVVEKVKGVALKTSKTKKKCSLCGKEFTNALALYNHMKTHNSEPAKTEAEPTEDA